ncbi:hypothetical protein Bbelb_021850 [Branchiostoma belcheri]|nr:hypothetical protein Bbelb_021850 [Branchiostoma belcheri]
MAPMNKVYLKDIGKSTSLITLNPDMIRWKYNSFKNETKSENVAAFVRDLSTYGNSYLWIPAFFRLYLVSAAIQICEEMHLYGFWPFHFDRNYRRLTEHYFDNALPGKSHRVPDVFKQLQRLHNTGVLRLTTNACQ